MSDVKENLYSGWVDERPIELNTRVAGSGYRDGKPDRRGGLHWNKSVTDEQKEAIFEALFWNHATRLRAQESTIKGFQKRYEGQEAKLAEANEAIARLVQTNATQARKIHGLEARPAESIESKIDTLRMVGYKAIDQNQEILTRMGLLEGVVLTANARARGHIDTRFTQLQEFIDGKQGATNINAVHHHYAPEPVVLIAEGV